jgi:hypothetical protein
MNWSKVSAELDHDGSLRDLYVFDISESDGDALLSALSAWSYEVCFLVDGEPAELPDSAGAVFELRKRASPILRVDVFGITVCAHFFGSHELELDLDPREVADRDRLASLSEFIRRLGDLLNRPVVLTHENRREHWIARYLPTTTQFSYPTPRSNHGSVIKRR